MFTNIFNSYPVILIIAFCNLLFVQQKSLLFLIPFGIILFALCMIMIIDYNMNICKKHSYDDLVIRYENMRQDYLTLYWNALYFSTGMLLMYASLMNIQNKLFIEW